MNTTDREDRFQLQFDAKDNPLSQGYEVVEEMVAGILESAGEFAPDRISAGKAPRQYSPAELRRLILAQKSSVKPFFTLTRSSPPDAFYTLFFMGEHTPLRFTLSMVTPFSCFRDSDNADARARSIVAIAKSLTRSCTPAYAYAYNRTDLSLSDDPRKDGSFAPNKIYEMYWLNLLGPEIVANVGRERVLSTPCFRLEELPGGSVLLLTRPTPADYQTPEARAAQARALAHLVDDVDFEKHLERLTERTRKLTPVTRNWDPDIEDLLDLTLGSVPAAERPSKTAELNQYRPPEVSEWRPIERLLDTDVGDVEETIDGYGIDAEKLAALLHKRVPSVMNAKPDSLPPIDYYFWTDRYAEEFKREDIETYLVPAIGAYLGEIIINYLGGHWVPRTKLDDTQLVLGDRAWLPFLRARHYMQNTQATLDYSLTKFYRTVERHSKGRSQ